MKTSHHTGSPLLAILQESEKTRKSKSVLVPAALP